MENLFEKLLSKYNELIECKNEAEQLLHTFKSINEPIRPASFNDEKEYDVYMQQITDWKQLVSDIERQYNNKKVLYDSLQTEIRSLVPYKAVWFRLPGTNTWIGKTSNNLVCGEGNLLHTHVSDNGFDLPKLITC